MNRVGVCVTINLRCIDWYNRYHYTLIIYCINNKTIQQNFVKCEIKFQYKIHRIIHFYKHHSQSQDALNDNSFKLDIYKKGCLVGLEYGKGISS